MIVKLIESFTWHPDLPIHGSHAYLRYKANPFVHLGGYEEGELCFVIACWIRRKGPFRWVVPAGETVVLRDFGVAAESAFLGMVVEHFRKLGVDWIAHCPPNGLFRASPEGAITAPFGSYRIDLRREEKDLWEALHQKHRNVIRNAQKQGLRVERNRDHRASIYQMMVQTMARSGKSFSSRADYDRLIDHLQGNIEVFSVWRGEQLQGGAIIPWSRYSAHYLWGGSVDKTVTGAMNFLHWEAMLFFRASGVATYDFVGARIQPEAGSKLEGIQRFKDRFGATMVTGRLWKVIFRERKYWMFRLLMRLRNKGVAYRDIVDEEMNNWQLLKS